MIYSSENDCPSECTTISYSTSLNHARYPTKYYANILMSQENISVRYTQQANTSLTPPGKPAPGPGPGPGPGPEIGEAPMSSTNKQTSYKSILSIAIIKLHV